MNNMWTDNRDTKLEKNVEVLITCKISTDISWCDSSQKIQSNKDFLKKLFSTEKYNWVNGYWSCVNTNSIMYYCTANHFLCSCEQ